MGWLSVAGILVTIAYYLILTRRSKKLIAKPQPSRQTLCISLEQARAELDDLVAEGKKLFVEPAGEASPLVDQLGPITKEFFSKYGVLRTRHGGFQLASAEVQASEYIHGYLSVGNSEDWDVIQRPGNDEIFIVEGAETSEADMNVRFPSVYHLVLDEVGHIV